MNITVEEFNLIPTPHPGHRPRIESWRAGCQFSVPSGDRVTVEQCPKDCLGGIGRILVMSDFMDIPIDDLHRAMLIRASWSESAAAQYRPDPRLSALAALYERQSELLNKSYVELGALQSAIKNLHGQLGIKNPGIRDTTND